MTWDGEIMRGSSIIQPLERPVYLLVSRLYRPRYQKHEARGEPKICTMRRDRMRKGVAIDAEV
jgi:hypothetical protein